MDFVLYFHQSYAWLWWNIVLWESKKSIYNCSTPLQKNSSLLAVIASWKACSRCQFHIKQSRNLLTMILVHIFLWGKDRNDTLGYANVIVKQKKKIVRTKTCRFDAHTHWHLFFLNQTWLTICTMSVFSIYYLIQWMMQE